MTNDVVGLADALGHEQFIVVGHDWGAPVAWHTALLSPRRVRAVAGMSVPHTRGRVGAYTQQENFGDNFWHMVYFQQPGVAEAEFEADIRKTLRTIYFVVSGDAPEGLWFIKKHATAKFLDGLPDPELLPAWLTEEDLDYYVTKFCAGHRHGLHQWIISREHTTTMDCAPSFALAHHPLSQPVKRVN